MDGLQRWLIDVWCGHEQLIFDEAIGQWLGSPRSCVHAKGGYFEYSLLTDNVDFVPMCYNQCDLFDCYIVNYKIMPATLTNTFLFFLQGSAQTDLGFCIRFQCTLGRR